MAREGPRRPVGSGPMDAEKPPAHAPDRPAPALHPATGAPGRRPRVMVLFGGRSGEHAISCATAGGVLRAIDRSRYDVLPVGITRSGRWVLTEDDPDRWAIVDGRLPEVEDTAAAVVLTQGEPDGVVQHLEPGRAPTALGQVDVVLPLLHGPFGEDGTLQGLLELADMRYVGAGGLASAASMHKHYMKMVLAGAGIPIGPHVVVDRRRWERHADDVREDVEELGWPVFVKPARAGS